MFITFYMYTCSICWSPLKIYFIHSKVELPHQTCIANIQCELNTLLVLTFYALLNLKSNTLDKKFLVFLIMDSTNYTAIQIWFPGLFIVPLGTHIASMTILSGKNWEINLKFIHRHVSCLAWKLTTAELARPTHSCLLILNGNSIKAEIP